MTDHPETPDVSADGGAIEQPTASWVPQPASATGGPEFGSAGGGDRPEVAIGAAFAGGLLAALILKRLAR